MNSVPVHRRFQHFIETSGKSRSEIARLCEVTPSAVTQWSREPKHEKDGGFTQRSLEKFCEVVGITLAEFWGDLDVHDAE